MIFPSADNIAQNIGSRYSLVVIAAKRAKQIKEGAPILIDTLSTNPLTIAMEEIAAGKVTIMPGSADVVTVNAADGAPSEGMTPTASAKISHNDGLPADVDGTDDMNIAGGEPVKAAA